MILFFTVDKQIITRQDYESVVQDSQNYLYAQFAFSEEWTGQITAVFKGKDGNAYNVLLDEGKCLVPWEVLTQSYFEVSVFCGDLITANVVKIFTITSGYAIGEESREPTPDIFTQIIEKIDGISAESIPYDNTDSGLSADNVQEAIDEIVEGGVVTTPDITMTAEVDATTGTPDVEVTKTGTPENPIFNLAFSGLKGETGSQGPTGATPNISATGSVSNTTGTPSVTITKTGTAENPNFDFAFSNIKGAKGDAGADGSVVTVTQTLQSGTKIGSISVDGTSTDLFAPSGGGSADLPWITPQDYGAVGDGVTDDSQAIQAAFNAGGNVYFPIGTYLVSGYVSVKSNTNVRGEYGKSIIIIDQTKDTDGTIVYFGVSGYGIENVLFENMVIHGSETYGAPQHGISCSQIWESENITFKNCIFRNNLYAASIMVKSSKVSYFGCRFEATDCGIQCLGQYPCSDITIKDCFFSGLSYYNNFTNYQSEPIAIYQGTKDNGSAKRWVIDSCEFEYKHTNAIYFGNSSLLPTGEDKTQVEDCSIRNITARSMVGIIAFTACRNVIAENIFYDNTDNIFPQTSSLYNIVNFGAYCDNVTVRCVKSDNDELLAPFAFAATSKNCMIDDAQIYGATSTSPTIQLQGTNHTLKGVVVNAKVKNGAVQYQNVTNSYVDVKAAVGSAYPIIHSFAVNSTNTGNTIIVYEDSLYPITKLNNVTSTSVANANTFNIVTESIVKKSVTTTRYINSSDLCSIVNVSIADGTTFEACMTTYDSWGLLEDGHKMTVEFNCAQALSSRDFKLPSTGNILPINSDTYKLAPAATYTVAEEFIQNSGKWVEVKRYIRYVDGTITELAALDDLTDVEISSAANNEILAYDGAKWKNENGNVSFVHAKNLLQLPDGEFSANNLRVVIKDNIITLNTINATTDKVYIKLTNGIALNVGSAPTAWRSETVSFIEAGKTYGIRDFSFGGSCIDKGMVASVRDSDGQSVLSRSRTNPVQFSASPAYIQLFVEASSGFVDYKVGVSITENEVPEDWEDITAYHDYWKQYISQCFLDTETFITTTPTGSAYATQGMCTDGEYLYTCLISNDDSANTYVYKYSLADGSLVTSVNSYSLGHCNSMTYCPKDGYIYCIALDTAGTVHRIKASDLSYVDSFTVDLTDVYSAYTGIGAISYNESRDVFVCLIRGNRKGYAILSRKYDLLDIVWTRKFYTVSGIVSTLASCFADDFFIYQAYYTYNAIQVFTYNGDYVGNIILPAALASTTLEFEDISIDGDYMYINIYQSGSPHVAKLAIHDLRYACILKR